MTDKSKNEKLANAVRYSSTRLLFKRDIIEALEEKQIFIIDVTKNEPTGSFAMSKADFYKVFDNVVTSKSYKEDGNYHYAKTPQKALQFLQ